MKKTLTDILNNHSALRNNCINLLPSENVISPLAKSFLSSDLGQRYFFKSPFSTSNGISYSYSGTKYIREIVELGENIARKLFNANYVSLYPISGHQANLAILFAFTKPGDNIVVFNTKYGGYPGLDKDKLPKYLNLNVFNLEVDENNTELINYAKSYELIERVKPTLVIYSSAHTIFPIDIKGLSEKSHKVGAKFIYDGSHPFGLIAGGVFQKPLQEGADILIGGTQKSFPGPQGAIIATNKYGKEIESVNHFVIVDNPHFHRIGALTVALAEMEKFGNQYAIQVVKNTKYLASELSVAGLPIKYKNRDFTESHMFKIELFVGFNGFVENLEKVNIMIDSAGRIGTAEMTRLGMKEHEMSIIADLIIQVYQGENLSVIKDKCICLREKFCDIKFCL